MPSDGFVSLERALAGWFDKDEPDLPADLREWVASAFLPLSWAALGPEQRRSVALQRDMAEDPALEGERQFWWQHACRVIELEGLERQWTLEPAVTVTELATKEARLREIAEELQRLAAREAADAARHRVRRGRAAGPTDSVAPADGKPAGPYVPFPRALKLLHTRFGASAEELAAWVFLGDTLGGLRAFLNANELDPPPRFGYAALGQDHGVYDFMGPLMGTWYSLPELEGFQPSDRFVTGRVLLERWAAQPGLSARAFILAKVRESRLRELHPLVGLTQASCNDSSLPVLDETLFHLSDIEAIEREDLGLEAGAEPVVAALSASNDAEPGANVATSGSVDPAPDWAPDWAVLGPDQRARRIQQRKRELQRAGVTAWRKQIASDLDISGRRVAQYLERLGDADPFTAMRSDLPRMQLDAPGKRKR